MGKGKKTQPAGLPEKLRGLRKFFGFSQEEMIKFVIPDIENPAAARAAISDYESGRRSPSILETFNYAKTVRLLSRHKQFNVEELINDERELSFLNGFVRERKTSSSKRRNIEVKPPRDQRPSGEIEVTETVIVQAKTEGGDGISGATDGQIAESCGQSSEQIFEAGNEAVGDETYTLKIAEATFMLIDNIRLELSKKLLGPQRRKLNDEKFIELLLETIAAEYDEGRGHCSVVEKLQTRL